MNEKVLFYFNSCVEAIPIYEKLEELVFAILPTAKIKVSKTQISFSGRYMFACASFLPVGKREERKDAYLTLTFGLGYRNPSPRVSAAVEAYPGRWTHHVLLRDAEDIDDEIIGLLKEAADFAERKGR